MVSPFSAHNSKSARGKTTSRFSINPSQETGFLVHGNEHVSIVSKRVTGMFHMVEAIIAITFILTFLIIMRSTIKPAEDTGLYQEYGFQALSVLDKKGTLRGNAMLENYTAIESDLGAMLPAELTESVEICYIGARCVGDALPDKTIYTSSYAIAGDETHLKPAEILLHMWRG